MADQLPSQLLAAITLASNPHQASSQSEVSSALTFLEQCRANSHQTWHAGWTVFTAIMNGNGQSNVTGGNGNQRHTADARIFALNLVEDFLEHRLSQSPDPASAVAFLQEASLAYIHQEFVEGNGEGGISFILNKFAQTLTLLLLASYSLPTSSTFLSSLLRLFRAHSPSSPASTSQVPLPQVSRSDPFNSSTTTALRLNALTTSLLLRHLHDLSLTLGSDASLRSVRSRDRLTRDAAIRDEIRAKDATELMKNLWEVASESVSIVDGNQETLKDGDERTMLKDSLAISTAEMSMKTLGAYSSWLDISLTLTPTSLPLMQHFLHHPTQLSLRYSALEPFTELINKGMKPHDKLEVLRILQVTTTIDSLESATHKDNRVAASSSASNAASSSGTGSRSSFNGTSFDLTSPLSYLFLTTMDGSELIEFRERLSKLTNFHLSEVVKILEDSSNGSAPADEGVIRMAEAESLKALETSVRWMSDEQDECAEAVASAIGAWLALQKKVKRRSQSSQNAPQIAPHLTNILQKLLEVILLKMKYDDDATWGGAGGLGDEEDRDGDEDSDDEERKFMDLRRMLHTLIASVSSLDEPLFMNVVQSLIFSTLDSYDSSDSSNQNQNGPSTSNPSSSIPSWQTAEMSLYAFYFFGEVISNSATGSRNGITSKLFVEIPESEQKNVNPQIKKQSVAYHTLPLSILGNLMSRLMQSKISNFPHPSIQLQYMEILVRYSSYFDKVRPNDIQSQQALPAFLDWRGVHHRKLGIRNRAQYLINRFVKDTRSVIPTEAVGSVMECLQDLLVVRAELPLVSEGEDPLIKATSTATSFDSQLYLFDTCGSLISLLSVRNEDERQVDYLKAVIEPLSNQLQQAVQSFISNSNDLQLVLQVHHLMLALSSLAKGFPDAPNASVAAPSSNGSSGNQINGSSASSNSRPGWVRVFASVTETILVALRALNQFEVVREAARGAIARIISSVGEALLPYVPPLIDALLTEAKAGEMVDFLSFLTMIVRKYKEQVQSSMDELFLVLLERVFYFLNQDISGTDDAVQRNELQKAYVGLMSALVMTGLDSVLISKKNQPQLQTVLQSLVYYSTNSDVSCQRVSLQVLSRLVTLWGKKTDLQQPNGSSTTSKTTSNGTSTSTSSSTPLPGFEQFIYETLVPLTFEAPAKDNFDFNDAQSQMVLGEISILLKSILEARGDEFLNYLGTVYLPGIQCPNDLIQELIHCIQNQDAKTLKKAIQAFVQRLRGQSS